MDAEPHGQAGEQGSYVLLFLYRVPKENHEALAQLTDQLATSFVKHGTMRSDFFQLSTPDTFAGFACIAKTIAATENEEVWVEIDSFPERKDRDAWFENVRADAALPPLFRQFAGLITGGYGGNSMGEFSRLGVRA